MNCHQNNACLGRGILLFEKGCKFSEFCFIFFISSLRICLLNCILFLCMFLRSSFLYFSSSFSLSFALSVFVSRIACFAVSRIACFLLSHFLCLQFLLSVFTFLLNSCFLLIQLFFLPRLIYVALV